jgi:hypothetical protein
MIDRPVREELLTAVREFLETELIPALTDQRLRFQTLVAANVLSIAEREWKEGESLAAADREGLARWFPEEQSNLQAQMKALCQRIRSGDFDNPVQFRALAAELRHSVERKLEVSNPRYLAAFRNLSG